MKYDVVATVGTYEKDGQKKYITRQVGQILDTKNGPKLLLDATFNPAGCHKGEDGKVWLALFEPKVKEPGKTQSISTDAPFDSEIPF